MTSKEPRYRRISQVKDNKPPIEQIKQKIDNFDPGKVINRIKSLPRVIREEYLIRTDQIPIYDVEHFSETQALRVLKKFGGVAPLLNAFKKIGKPRSRSTVYRWLYSRGRGGTGGLIPTSVWPDLLVAARLEGVFISGEEMDARVQHLKKFTPIAVLEQGKITPYLNSNEIKQVLRHEALLKTRADKRRERAARRKKKRLEKMKIMKERQDLRNKLLKFKAKTKAQMRAKKCKAP